MTNERIFSALAAGEHITPDRLFIELTSAIYSARLRGDLDTIETILSVFEPAARRALLIGAAALRVMPGSADAEYRDAVKAALCETLYDMMKGSGKHD